MVAIDDEEYNGGIISQPELVLVDNSRSEWEHWHNLGKCIQPVDYDVVNAKTRELNLDGRQRCKLLFKFQSFREPVVDQTRLEDQSKDQENELRPK